MDVDMAGGGGYGPGYGRSNFHLKYKKNRSKHKETLLRTQLEVIDKKTRESQRTMYNYFWNSLVICIIKLGEECMPRPKNGEKCAAFPTPIVFGLSTPMQMQGDK